MKWITNLAILTLSLFMPISGFGEECLFDHCPEPVTQEERLQAEALFHKARYILGAAYNTRSMQLVVPDYYKNIPDHTKRTAKLKQDIVSLEESASALPATAAGLIKAALFNTRLCVSYSKTSGEHCDVALQLLREWYFENQLGANWSGYEVTRDDWTGFPVE